MVIKTPIKSFPTDLESIFERVDKIDPVKYGSTRNYIDGAVTYLSPYISRGVISTKFVLKKVLEKGYNKEHIEKLIQELTWRDYWQQVWIAKGDEINTDLKNKQPSVTNHKMPKAIINAATGINAIDKAIEVFYETGYLHNHLRMYIASVACNIGGSHWKIPAKWMYYYLLDGDWASNGLSWQWVAGSNSNKKYFANQENINKYCYSDQKNTFLEVPYEAFPDLEIPEVLKELTVPDFVTELPENNSINIDSSLPTCIYNYYNLDPEWKKETSANRILLLEPSVFKNYPVSKMSIDFALQLAENISGIQIYVGEFNELISGYDLNTIYYKEHPLNNYEGNEEAREMIFEVTGYYPSFFSYWKRCKKQLYKK